MMKRATLSLVIFGAWCLGMALIFNDTNSYVFGVFCWGLAWLNERINLKTLLSGELIAKNEIKDFSNIDMTYDFTSLRTLFEEGERK